MAAYNAWQNSGLIDVVQAMDEEDLRADRGAFFGSIWGTLNHLLWADALWVSRFDGGDYFQTTIPQSVDLMPTTADWLAARKTMDTRFIAWADIVKPEDLTGDLAWYSKAMSRQFTKTRALCVMQMFNHQTHHRGQIHMMLTSLGINPQDTDLPFMPEA